MRMMEVLEQVSNECTHSTSRAALEGDLDGDLLGLFDGDLGGDLLGDFDGLFDGPLSSSAVASKRMRLSTYCGMA
jgi:hypothetical protein